MPDKIRIMIVDDVETSQKGLARLLSFEPDMDVIGFAGTGSEAIAKAQIMKPDVILMDINMPDMDGLTATEQITQVVACSVVMISVQSDRDYMRRAMQAGAVDFLPKPPSADELYATVRNAYERRPKVVAGGAGKPDPNQPSSSGHIIVVYSPQGGSGATTLAVNIAGCLLSQQDRTVLVDGNLQFGDAAVHLDVRTERNIINLVQASGDLDSDLIENVLMTHGSGLRILAAPRGPEEASEVHSEHILQIVQTLANQFRYVVVDTAPHLDGVTIGLLELADVVVLVGVPTLPAVKNMKLILELFDQSPDFDKNKLIFVMNKMPVDKKSGALNPEDISRSLRLPIKAVIPAIEKAFLESLNRGVPVIVNARQSPGREVQQLGEEIKKMMISVEVEEPATGDKPKPRKGLFG
ncbi:MAG: response regulator [Chloroflexi bacterium]|nr:response regulator [Chloroflexota bacterium]